MARQKRTITGPIPGHATHTRTAETYMGALLDAVSLDDWREVVQSTVNSRHTLTTSPPRGQGTSRPPANTGAKRRERALAIMFIAK